jgi:hypothetical protein
MKIKKIAQPINKGLLYNEYSNSNEDGYTANFINSLLERNILTVALETDNTGITSTANYQRVLVPLTLENYKKGTKLSASSNGGILIGEGITDIKISASILCTGNTDEWGISVYKNNTEIAFLVEKPYSNLSQKTISAVPIQVQEGDIITLRIYINTNGTTKTLKKYSGNSTRLTVEAI